LKKDNIGAILKNLIKERGYTQEEFADEVGIGLSTLKKYINGQVSYSIDTLILFAEFFDCSYDYLLGKSLTPDRDKQDLKQATRLSDGALDRIKGYASSYDDDFQSKRYLDTLSNLIQSEFLIERIVNYFYLDPNEFFVSEPEDTLPQSHIYVGNEQLFVPDIEDAYLLGIIKALTKAKTNIGHNVPTILRNLKTKCRNLFMED